MSRMSDLVIEITELDNAGYSIREIAEMISWPVEGVESVLAAAYCSEPDFDDSMDGDAESALASAGWGMDEDYGDLPF